MEYGVVLGYILGGAGEGGVVRCCEVRCEVL